MSVDNLRRSVENFTSLGSMMHDGSPQLFHKVVASMHELCFQILRAEKDGYSRERIEEVIRPVRDIHGRSVFVKRLQEWPRKYPGDFETIEYICDHENKSLYGTVEYFIEEYALNSAIAQQHRNKLQYQSGIILDALLNGRAKQKILSVGCGGCRDIMNIERYIHNVDCELYINDIEGDALELSKERLQAFMNVYLVYGNFIQTLRKLEKLGPFDLVLTGGLFDHVSDKHVSFFLKQSKTKLLNHNSTLFFTNAVKGNPFKVWMEYLANWRLSYRSREELIDLLLTAGFTHSAIRMKKDETGLTFLAEVKS